MSGDTPEPETSPASNAKQGRHPTSAPFRVLNLNFSSKKTFLEFLLASTLVTLVPILLVLLINQLVKDNSQMSQLGKTAITVGPPVLLINVVMGVYLYRAIKDPENYEVDEPLESKT